MITNNIKFDNETHKALFDFKNQLRQDDDIHCKNNNLAIKKALIFASEYYGLRFYGKPKEIEEQLYK